MIGATRFSTLAAAVALSGVAGPLRGQAPGPAAEAAPDRLTVEWAVDAALLHYPAMGAARGTLDGARAGDRAARAAWWPSITVGGTLTRHQFPMLVRPLHELDASQIRFDPEPVQGSLFMDWLVFDGGERRARIRQAEALAERADAGLEVTEMTVIEATVTAFLRVATLREVRQAQTVQVRALDAERGRAELLLQSGRAPRVQVLRAQAALSQARADLASIEAMLRASEDQLARLVGMEGGEVTRRDLGRVDATGELVGPPASVSSLPLPADSLHPALRASWSQVMEAQAIRSETKAAWIPDLGLSAGARQYGATSGDFANEWQIGIALSYPLFTGFRRSSQIEAAEARLGVARENHRLARFEAARELDEAQAALIEADARVLALEGAVQQFDEVARIEALALEAGAGVQRDFLDAQADLFRSRAALAEARNGRVVARTRRAAALGELDRDWIAENLESRP